MNNLKGTKTEKNLMEAFAGESQARNKYTYYASKARKDGYEQIAAIFEETANNEKEHAKLWFKELHGGEVPTTLDNLKDAASGENYEWTNMYDRMAKEAREEGFTRIAFLFEEVGKIEKEHEERFEKVTKKAVEEKFDLLIMDEIIASINLNLISLDEVIEFLKNKPKTLEVVLTGRNPNEKLVELSDYVSEIKAIKHPYEKGISSRIGIDK